MSQVKKNCSDFAAVLFAVVGVFVPAIVSGVGLIRYLKSHRNPYDQTNRHNLLMITVPAAISIVCYSIFRFCFGKKSSASSSSSTTTTGAPGSAYRQFLASPEGAQAAINAGLVPEKPLKDASSPLLKSGAHFTPTPLPTPTPTPFPTPTSAPLTPLQPAAALAAPVAPAAPAVPAVVYISPFAQPYNANGSQFGYQQFVPMQLMPGGQLRPLQENDDDAEEMIDLGAGHPPIHGDFNV